MSDELLVPQAASVESVDSAFKCWEKLRLFYNVVLSLFLIPLAGKSLLDPFFVFCCLCQRGMANICFCAGPVAEGYFSLLGFDRKWARYGVFLCGTLLACLIEFLVIREHFENPDGL